MVDFADALALAASRLEGLSQATDRFPTPHDLAKALDPRVVATPALELLDRNLMDVAAGKTRRLIWTMPPQEGKSQRVSRTFPAWLLARNPDLRIAIASYEFGTARRWGRAIRNDISANTDLFGLRVRHDTGAAHEWQLEDHAGGVYSVGIAGALTGRPVDVLIIDDPIKGRAEAESLVQREKVWDFWVDTARTRFGPETAVIVVLTRWHEDDLAGRLLAADKTIGEWTYVNIPAQAEAADDPLGRKPGEYLVSARGRGVADWESTKRDVGARTWTSLYQGRPAPAEGGLFRRDHWRWYQAPKADQRADGSYWIPNATEVIQSWDMTFKDSRTGDFVVGQVWAKINGQVYLMDQICDRLDFPATCRAVTALSKRWPQAHAKLVEDRANGPAVISQLRSTVPGLIPVTPKESKFARASSVAPFVESGVVWLPAPEIAPWIGSFLEETAGFPNASHDDQVDAMTQALHRLLAGSNSADRALGWLDSYTSIPRPAPGTPLDYLDGRAPHGPMALPPQEDPDPGDRADGQ
ncbi:phage terminase large subunit [Kitasatospora sp. NPDC085464]|uniref:phage terminase large subunit n=1 Tax=Kitasatospora sp. NPDC085464 TaxID=3364063 RepID=UPI0037C9FE73